MLPDARPYPTDAMVDAYLQAQRSAVEEADRFGRPNVGGLHTNTVREACRAGLAAALAAQPAPAPERNFCARCGKRLGGEGHIHTCTPPAADALPQGEEARDATGRTPTDYALEHAEYMAKDAERLIEAVNADAAVRLRIAESDDVDDATEQDAKDDVSEMMRGLRSGIYEFRKRRDRAASAPKGGEADR